MKHLLLDLREHFDKVHQNEFNARSNLCSSMHEDGHPFLRIGLQESFAIRLVFLNVFGNALEIVLYTTEVQDIEQRSCARIQMIAVDKYRVVARRRAQRISHILLIIIKF